MVFGLTVGVAGSSLLSAHVGFQEGRQETWHRPSDLPVLCLLDILCFFQFKDFLCFPFPSKYSVSLAETKFLYLLWGGGGGGGGCPCSLLLKRKIRAAGVRQLRSKNRGLKPAPNPEKQKSTLRLSGCRKRSAAKGVWSLFGHFFWRFCLFFRHIFARLLLPNFFCPTPFAAGWVYMSFFEKFVRTSACFLCHTWVRNPPDVIQKNLFRWNFLFLGGFFRGGFSFSEWSMLQRGRGGGVTARWRNGSENFSALFWIGNSIQKILENRLKTNQFLCAIFEVNSFPFSLCGEPLHPSLWGVRFLYEAEDFWGPRKGTGFRKEWGRWGGGKKRRQKGRAKKCQKISKNLRFGGSCRGCH